MGVASFSFALYQGSASCRPLQLISESESLDPRLPERLLFGHQSLHLCKVDLQPRRLLPLRSVLSHGAG